MADNGDKSFEKIRKASLRHALLTLFSAIFLIALATTLMITTSRKDTEDGGNVNEDIERIKDENRLSETFSPSAIPSSPPTDAPSLRPSAQPSNAPSEKPTTSPSSKPTTSPSSKPTTSPSHLPSSNPTSAPSAKPSFDPTSAPSAAPSNKPTFSPSQSPSSAPTEPVIPVTYIPGNLTTFAAGLLLSEGLDAREIASKNKNVIYADGTRSRRVFHSRPDGAAVVPDTRPENPGGWVYVSNSEVETSGGGGVGAITFNKDGEVIDYKRILGGTTMNCGGGRTPWNTWISCEEVEYSGKIYQVDPFGERRSEVITLGSDGGRWEAFAFDIRDKSKPRFYATEDHNKGTVRRFTPTNPNWDDPWTMLTGPGVTDYLMIHPNATNDGGTYEWTTNLNAAKSNAKAYYPQTEGIDVYKNEMVFVCKRIYQAFTINLDDGTYFNHTTVSGLFDGKPDQMQRILDSPRDLLYFTEEGGVDAGVHARDYNGRFYTIFESSRYTDETSGLAFSPDGMHMYVAYQGIGKLFDVWRKDGQPFHFDRLNVKYHQTGEGRI